MIQGTNRRGLLAGLTASVALSAVAVFTLSGSRAQGDTAPAAPPAIPVSVATVEARDIVPWAEFSGRLEAIERVELRSRVAGVVEAVHFREGNLVKRGDLLVSIDQAPYLADLQRAEAQVQGAKARVALAESENERGQQLLATRNLSQRDVDTRVNNLREAQANLQVAEAARRTAQLNLDYTQIRAPISGRIGRLDVTIGNLIAASGQVLTSLLSVDPIYAAFNADERSVLDALASLPDGSRALEQIPVRLTTATAQAAQFSGRLHFVDNGIDATSGTVRVRARLDNPDGKLMPGQFVRVQLGQAKAEQQLVINERAVGTDQNKKFVFVVGDDAKATWREVSLGAAHDGLRIVNAGLKPGERIIVNGLQRVRPGATVAPEPVPMAQKSELKKPATELAQR
jgi:multidrug efflux system membrane fusion protein